MKLLLTSIIVFTLSITNAFSHDIPSTLDQIKETGKIRIGFRKSEPPMSFTDKEGNPVGYSINLCERIVAGMKIELDKEISVEFVPVTANSRFDAIKQNKIDILCGSTTKTLSRGKHVDFTQLTFVTGASFMTLKGQEFKEFSELNGKKIGVVSDTTTHDQLKRLIKETQTNAEVITFKTADDALNSLRKGEIIAYTSDQVVLIGLAITAKDGEEFSISPQVYSYEPFAFAVRRNDADFRLMVDSVLSRLYRFGEINKIYDKWFGSFVKEHPPLHDALYQLNATPE